MSKDDQQKRDLHTDRAGETLEPEAMSMTGIVIGYDPGGNGKHGVARATLRDGDILSVTTTTCNVVEDVVASIVNNETPLGLGVDTLTCWATGHNGWRPADRWLRQRYDCVQNSVVAPNSLYGAMSLSGMALLVTVRQAFPDLFVTETHPKVLYYTQFNERYDYTGPNASVMDKRLRQLLAANVAPRNEHEWDAAISILAVVRGLNGSWRRDLHDLPTDLHECLVHPCGRTAYVWPQ